MRKTDLSLYNNSSYDPGGSIAKRILWYYINAFLFKTSFIPSSLLKVWLLRLFGASVGKGVVIKPCVNIKYPWLLQIGDHSWVGENVWIDNLVSVHINNHVCISQGALLLTGSHNYKDPAFGLTTGSIILEDGVWIGAKAIITHGVTVGAHAVLCAGSVATKNLIAFAIYQGNPATEIRHRSIDLS
ncbi:MAG: putative colanic acid biosynthesis acetyltransferase [Candidatus Pedobacter colombiensis]|uniref:Colanic acid biosynthesis acetyltransferase n=1 Tax=Candidatus Pedobacter colombiensis TaxID=3121371 RepID=A0AAJ5W9N7_9SPHI|nr:putative colanic acid biosynthesis acetyltransferase [Pedobacter sp.]WEK19691.1 MAG: putative colanic acid biosynthesis acetyltransferase [Pedobacter sp.]